jgi:hypothetical protein
MEDDCSAAVNILLRPGEFILFNEGLVHASSEAQGVGIPPRIAFALRVTVPSTAVYPAAFTEIPERDHKCVLLHGTDSFAVNPMRAWPN